MNINTISYANYSINKNLKKEQASVNNYTNPINFRAKLNPPKLYSPSSIKVLDKFRAFPPNSKLPEGVALFFEVEGQKYGMKVDKFNENKTTLIVKNMITAADNWDTMKPNQSSLSCIFDKNGIMIYSELMKKRNENFTNRFVLVNEKTTARRRILHESTFLRPLKNSSDRDIWNSYENRSGHENLGEFNLKKEYADIDFSELFFELAKPNVSVL